MPGERESGAAITLPGTAVSDALGRVIFTPVTNAFGQPYTSFGFVASDGQAVSSAATMAVEVMGPPWVATQRATITGAGNAVLNGMVMGSGLGTIAWFEWGVGSLTNSTTVTNTGAGLGVARVSLPVAGLAPRVIYQCRLVASNTVGVARGAEQLFTTGESVTAWGLNDGGQALVPVGLTNVVALAGGQWHNLALRSDGRVTAWGNAAYNNYGQTNVPAGLTNAVAVGAGTYHSLALRADGRLVAWGYNGYGQTNVPAGLSNVVAVAAGGYHNLALTTDGRVAAWGYNGYGQTNVPAGLSNVVGVAAGLYHSLALTAVGQVVGWGNNSGGQISVPVNLTNAVALAAGDYHSLALTSDGRVVAWGTNSSGQLNVPASLTNVLAVAAGWGHNLALTADGRVIAWGNNSNGQTNVAAGLTNVASVAAGDYHSLVVGNLPPQATPGTSRGIASQDLVITPTGSDPNNDPLTFRITTLPAAGMLYQLLANGSRGAAIVAPGTAVSDALGRVIFAPVPNAFGQPYTTFGFVADDGQALSGEATMVVEITGPPLAVTQPVAITGTGSAALNGMVVGNGAQTLTWFEWGLDRSMSNVTSAVSAGPGLGVAWVSLPVARLAPRVTYHCQLVASNAFGVVRGAEELFTTGKEVLAWGYNGNGQTNVPAGLSNVVAAAGGQYHSLVLKSDGGVLGWGRNDWGQCSTPAGLSNALAVAAGDRHNLALTADGQVVAWGAYDYGQTTVPAGLSNVVAIAAGYDDSLALTADGHVVGWGYNGSGQINVPAGLSNVVGVAGGQFHSLALTADGKVVVWGSNSSGQTNVPAGLGNVVAVAAGYAYSLALQADGRVVAWGDNTYGQLNVPASLSNVVAVAGGGYHCLALTSDGRLAAWGYNFAGQATVPPNLSNVVSVAAGGTHSLVVLDGRCRIVQQPQAVQLLPGDTAGFQISVESDDPVSYQWLFNGAGLTNGGKIIGATTAQLTVANVSSNELGAYNVVVTYPYGVITSSVAGLRFTSRNLQLGSTSTAPGTLVTLPVRLASDDGEHSLGFSVAYDTNLLTFVSAIRGADATDATFSSTAGAGQIGISLARPAGVSFTNGLYEVALLNFNAAAIPNSAVTALTFGDVPTARAVETTGSLALPTAYNAGGVAIVPAGAVVPSGYSSLFKQVIHVTNPANAGGPVAAVRLWFYGLGVDSKGYPIQVYNATGTSNGVPFILWNGPLAAGSSVDLTVEYYIADRTTMPHPVIVVEFPGAQTFTVPDGTVLSATFQFVNGNGVVQFSTLAGHTYYIQYADDAAGAGGWRTALPAVTGSGGIIQWIDSGPPKTESAPSAVPSRFYRVLLVP